MQFSATFSAGKIPSSCWWHWIIPILPQGYYSWTMESHWVCVVYKILQIYLLLKYALCKSLSSVVFNRERLVQNHVAP